MNVDDLISSPVFLNFGKSKRSRKHMKPIERTRPEVKPWQNNIGNIPETWHFIFVTSTSSVVPSVKIPHLQSCCTLLQKNSQLQPGKSTLALGNHTLPIFAILCLALYVSESDAGQSRGYELLLIHTTQWNCDVSKQRPACANNSKAEKADLVQAKKSACKAWEYVKDSANLLSLPQLRRLWLFQINFESFAIIVLNCMNFDNCKLDHTHRISL